MFRIFRIARSKLKVVSIVLLTVCLLFAGRILVSRFLPSHVIEGILVEDNMAVQSVDGEQLFVILPGSRIVIAHRPTSLPPPTVSTVLPEPTEVVIEVVDTATPEEEIYRVRLSHYWPPLGPPNCHEVNWNNGVCTALLTDGQIWEHWSYWSGVGTACPKEFKKGTKFSIKGFGIYTCIDRGGAITELPDGTFFLDLLTPEQPYVNGGEVIRDEYSPSGSYVVEATIVD